MATFVHIADIHVGMGFKSASFSRELGTSRRNEIKETLFRVIKYCETNKIDLLLIAGDLFEDDYVSISDLKDMNHRFGGLSHTKVLISAGNHDPVINKNSSYNLIAWHLNVHLFDTSMSQYHFEDLDTVVHSFSWNKKHLPALDLASLDQIDQGGDRRHHILMLHGDAYGQGDYLSIDPKSLENLGYDYIALGHIHKMDYIRPWMAYPGSLEPMDFSEVGDHGFIEGEINGDGLTSSFVPFAKRSFRQVELEVSGDMTYEAIIDFVSGSLKGLGVNEIDMYRVTLSGYVDGDITFELEDLRARFKDQVYYIEFVDKSQPDIDIEAIKKAYEGTLISDYIDYMMALDIEEDLKEEALYEGLQILLREQVL